MINTCPVLDNNAMWCHLPDNDVWPGLLVVIHGEADEGECHLLCLWLVLVHPDTTVMCYFVITLAMLVVSVPPVAGTGPYFVRSSFDHLKVVGWSPALQTLDCYSYRVYRLIKLNSTSYKITSYLSLSILFSFQFTTETLLGQSFYRTNEWRWE